MTTPEEELTGPPVTGTALVDDDDIANAGREIEQKQQNTTANLIWRLQEAKLQHFIAEIAMQKEITINEETVLQTKNRIQTGLKTRSKKTQQSESQTERKIKDLLESH